MDALKNAKLVFCDWSGVISDDRRPVYEANRRMAQHYGLPHISFDEWLGTTTMSVFEWFDNLGVSVASDELYAHYEDAFQTVLRDGIAPTIYADAQHFLSSISRTRPVVVVSAHPEQFLLAEGTEYGVAPFIERFIGSSRDKPAAMRALLEERGLSSEDAFIVGDTTHDIRAGKAAHVSSVGVATGYHSRPMLETESPDLVVDSLTELLEHL